MHRYRQTLIGVPFYKMLFQEHISLAPHTTFGIGGPARWFAQAHTEHDILEGVAFAKDRGLPLFVLGGGSNLLVSDAGFAGLVLHIDLKGITLGNDGLLSAAAGEDWDQVVSQAVAANCAGVECLAGIPGSVGGTPVQNVGAYGQEVSQTIVEVRALDTQLGAFVDLPSSACGFSYRQSIFNHGTERGRYIVTRVMYQLQSSSEPTLSYGDLKRYFQDWSKPPRLAEVAAAVREIRKAKGMLLVEGDPDCASAGSFFKNPVVPEAALSWIQNAAGGSTVPHFAAGDGLVKVPAAWLLERAGFHKGFSMGRAGISTRHTLALVNRGGATAAEIIALRDQIRHRVEHLYGIRLEPEPVWVA
jgi:UDP-N-acetylmuramate dehydrogenase